MSKFSHLDYRAEFANEVCQMLYELYLGDFDQPKFIDDVKKFYNYFYDQVRNIYEEVENIPLFEYYQYYKSQDPQSRGDIDYEDKTIEFVLKDVEKLCHIFYGSGLTVSS